MHYFATGLIAMTEGRESFSQLLIETWSRGQYYFDYFEVKGMTRIEQCLTFCECAYLGESSSLARILDETGDFEGYSATIKSGMLQVSGHGESLSSDVSDPVSKMGFCNSIDQSRALLYALEKSQIQGLIPTSGVDSIFGDMSESENLDWLYDHRAEIAESLAGLELPVLCGGELLSPELVVSLAQLKADSFSHTYEDVLFWADRKMLKAFRGDIIPLSSAASIVSIVTMQNGTLVTDEIHIDRLDEKGRAPDFEGIDVFYVKLGLSGAARNGELTKSQLRAVSSYAKQSVRLGLGLGNKPEMVLCSAKLGFLSGFPLGEVSPKSLAFTSYFVSKLNPFNNLFSIPLVSGPLYKGIPPGIRAIPPPDLFRYACSASYSNELVRRFPASAWTAISHSTDRPGVEARMFKAKYGIDVKEALVTRLSALHINLLSDEGYRFPSGTKLEMMSWGKGGKNPENEDYILDKVTSMALGDMHLHGVDVFSSPSEVTSLQSGSSTTRSIMSAIARRHGVEVMVEAAGTNLEHWSRLIGIFGHEPLIPFASRMPDPVKIEVVMSDFNL